MVGITLLDLGSVALRRVSRRALVLVTLHSEVRLGLRNRKQSLVIRIMENLSVQAQRKQDTWVFSATANTTSPKQVVNDVENGAVSQFVEKVQTGLNRFRVSVDGIKDGAKIVAHYDRETGEQGLVVAAER